MKYDIFLVGVGGQGVLTIGELITEAAILGDIHVNYYPTEGMAQRGGFVKAQIRLGRKFAGPQIPEKSADLLISMEVSESLKAVRYIHPKSEFVLWGHVWLPTAAMLGKTGYPPVETVEAEITKAGAKITYIDPATLPNYKGSPVADNIFVLGSVFAATKIGEILPRNRIEEVILQRWPKNAERNLFAFQSGFESIGMLLDEPN